jgi:hypothetical protein
MGHTIIPGGTFRFLPCNAEQDLVESVLKLIELHQERKELNRQLGSVIDNNERARLLLCSKEIVNPGFVIERKNFRELLEIRRGFSQFDLLNGDHVPKEIVQPLMNMTFEEITNLVKVA